MGCPERERERGLLVEGLAIFFLVIFFSLLVPTWCSVLACSYAIPNGHTLLNHLGIQTNSGEGS